MAVVSTGEIKMEERKEKRGISEIFLKPTGSPTISSGELIYRRPGKPSEYYKGNWNKTTLLRMGTGRLQIGQHITFGTWINDGIDTDMIEPNSMVLSGPIALQNRPPVADLSANLDIGIYRIRCKLDDIPYRETLVKNKKGVLTYTDGSMYQGDWEGDKRQGIGLYRNQTEVLYGTWMQDELDTSKEILRGTIHPSTPKQIDFESERKEGIYRVSYPIDRIAFQSILMIYESDDSSMTYHDGSFYKGPYPRQRNGYGYEYASRDSNIFYREGIWNNNEFEYGIVVEKDGSFRIGDAFIGRLDFLSRGRKEMDRTIRFHVKKFFPSDLYIYEKETTFGELEQLRFKIFFDKKGTIRFTDGSHYKGDIIKSIFSNAEIMMHGQGRLDFQDGSFYEGQWHYNSQFNQGLFVVHPGTEREIRYEGKWCLNKKNGVFTVTTPLKEEIVLFADDQPMKMLSDAASAPQLNAFPEIMPYDERDSIHIMINAHGFDDIVVDELKVEPSETWNTEMMKQRVKVFYPVEHGVLFYICLELHMQLKAMYYSTTPTSMIIEKFTKQCHDFVDSRKPFFKKEELAKEFCQYRGAYVNKKYYFRDHNGALGAKSKDNAFPGNIQILRARMHGTYFPIEWLTDLLSSKPHPIQIINKIRLDIQDILDKNSSYLTTYELTSLLSMFPTIYIYDFTCRDNEKFVSKVTPESVYTSELALTKLLRAHSIDEAVSSLGKKSKRKNRNKKRLTKTNRL